jgi:hypothetical protein
VRYQVIFIPQPTETKRDCIIGQDGRRYCEDENATPQQVGVILLAVVGFILWFIGGLILVDRHDWGWRGGVLYFAGPWVALGIGLVMLT